VSFADHFQRLYGLAWKNRTRRQRWLIASATFLLAAPIFAFWNAYPRFSDSPMRSPVSRVRADLRSVAVALESYFTDNRSYPAMTPMRGLNGQLPPSGAPWPLTMTYPGGLTTDATVTSPPIRVFGLTTPIAYTTSIFPDASFDRPDTWPWPFELDTRLWEQVHDIKLWWWRDVMGNSLRSPYPFAYYTTGHGWILISTGPDRDYDIVPAAEYDPAKTVPSPALIEHTYDPTNGTTSNGDVYRMKED
jgi:hypothetical protein